MSASIGHREGMSRRRMVEQRYIRVTLFMYICIQASCHKSFQSDPLFSYVNGNFVRYL